jgi:hypothetical protein
LDEKSMVARLDTSKIVWKFESTDFTEDDLNVITAE